MPSTVSELFAAARLTPAGPVRWGTAVPETRTGVYAVSLTEDSTWGRRAAAPVSRAALEHLLDVRPELRLNLARPDAEALIGRLGGFWLPDEMVLYVGLAGQPLRTRVRQYYGTPLGARRPHAGGWWLKTLSVLDELWVFWAATTDYERAERLMLEAFASGVPSTSRRVLLDDERVMPFANLRGHDSRIKEHRIRGATGELSAARDSGGAGARTPKPAPQTPPTARAGSPARNAASVGSVTQRVTAADLTGGRIRLPRPSKALLPAKRGDVTVGLRGADLRARWDPRIGPPERSGVLAFGRGKLDGLVEVDEVLGLAAGDGAADLELS
jgi:hypothetical protein